MIALIRKLIHVFVGAAVNRSVELEDRTLARREARRVRKEEGR